MDIRNRLSNLQRRMEVSEKIGTFRREVKSYQETLKEIVLVNRWLDEQCSRLRTIKHDSNGNWGFVITNNTGLDFEYIKIKMKVYDGKKSVKNLEARCGLLPNGDEGWMIFDKEPADGQLIIVGESINYKLA